MDDDDKVEWSQFMVYVLGDEIWYIAVVWHSDKDLLVSKCELNTYEHIYLYFE